MAGVPVPIPESTQPKPEDVRSQFTLPSGKEVIFRKGKGRDLRVALMAAGPGADQYRILMALIAQLATIDGKKTTFEAVDDMDLDDVMTLQREASEVLLPLAKRPIPKAAEEQSFLQ